MKKGPPPAHKPSARVEFIVSIGTTLATNFLVFGATLLTVRAVIRKLGRPSDKRRATIAAVVLALFLSRPFMVQNKRLAALQDAQKGS